MQWELDFQGQPLIVIVGQNAYNQLSFQANPLFVRMSLEIQDFPIKRVHFHHTEPTDTPFVAFGSQLFLAYQGVVARHLPGTSTAAAPIWESPSSQLEKCKPRWLQLDYFKSTWKGIYGFRLEDAPALTSAPVLLDNSKIIV